MSPNPHKATVDRVAKSTNPIQQKAMVARSKPRFSHDSELPLSIRIAKQNWWNRTRLTVTTTEPVWYRDAVVWIEIATGFVSDLGSIPSILWWFVSPWDIALESLFHDSLYQNQEQGIERYVADAMLRSMMQARGVPTPIVLAVYWAVRLFGGKAWKEHAKKK